MARKPRVHFSGAFYHVMLRGNDGKQIFFSNKDREYFYFLIDDGIKRYGHRIHAICLMNNHVHLAIQVGDISLSKIVQNVSFRYTRHINKQQKKVGHLFQGRYKAILVDAENYLLGLIRYIHLNPVRANIVKNAKNYTWSSHRTYLGIDNIPWITSDYVLNYFDSRHDSTLCSYVEFMQDNTNQLLQKEFQVGNQRNYSVLSNDQFFRQLKNITTIFVKSNIDLNYLACMVSLHYSVDISQLKSPIRSRSYARIRAVIAWLAKELNVCSFSEVGNFFQRDATGLIRIIRRLEGTLASKEELVILKKLIEESVCQA